MTNRLRTKVRLVKCPKCSKILPEPEQVPLYTCGGCGTILQAKYYRGKNRTTGLDSNEQVAMQSNGIVQARDGGESGGSSQKSSSAGGQLSDQNEGKDQNAAGNHNSERISAINSARFSSSLEESHLLGSNGNVETDNRTDRSNIGDGALMQKEGQLRAANSANDDFWQLSDQKEGEDQNTAENHNSERISAANSAGFGSLPKESHLLGTNRNVVTDNRTGQSDIGNGVLNQKEEQLRSANSVHEDSCTQAEGATVLEDNAKCDGIAAENHYQKCVPSANASKEASRTNGSQVLESKELLQLSADHVALANTKALQIARLTEDEVAQDQHFHEVSSDCQNHVGDGNSVREASALNESLVTDNKGIACNGSDHHILRENGKELSEDELSHERLSKEVMTTSAQEQSHGKKVRDDFIVSLGEQLGSIKLSEASLSSEISQVKNDNSTAGIEANPQVCPDAGEMGSCNSSRDPYCESNSLKKAAENMRRKIEDFNDGSAYGPESMRSADTTIALEPVNAHGEDGRAVRVVPRSLTQGSLAYDGSISSFDGHDDQVEEQQEHFKSSGFQNQAKSSFQILADDKLKSRKLEKMESSAEENSTPLRNKSRQIRDGFLHRGVPLYRSSELVYETGSSSSFIHDELPIHRMHNHPYRYEDSQPWVRKANAQNRHMDRRRFPEAMWRENESLSSYYNYETSGEIYHRSRHHGYTDRRRRAESWSLSGNLAPVNYSGEMLYRRYQMRDPCMHNGHPNDFRWSAQLPPPNPRAFGWDPYDSYPSSPQRFMEPEPYSWTQDVVSVSDDQRQRDQIMRRLYFREKRQNVSRHFHPLAGGAPFITCYLCFRVVQLPGDFLLRMRKSTVIHRVKCGACSSILKFSFENGSCLTPCIPNDDASEGAEINASRNDDSAEVGSRNSRNEEKMERSHRVGGRSKKVIWQLHSRRSKSPLHQLMGYSSPHDVFNGHEGVDVDC